MQFVPYSRLSGFPKLFVDYVEDYGRVEEFFNGRPAHNESWLQQFTRIDAGEYHREKLIDILSNHNGECGSRRIIAKQLKKFEDPRSAVVITGQQAGIFWGPLYTVYKAISTIRFAEYLEKTYNRPVIPLFWLEVDDHDFNEVRQFHLMLPTGEIRKFQYSDDETDKPVPVKNRKITSQFSTLLEELASEFGSAVNAGKTIAEIQKIYQPGRDFADVFIRFFRKYFPKLPLLFINPGDAAMKQLAKPFFQRVIAKNDAIQEELESQTELLVNKKYQPQVAVRSGILHLFHVVNNERARLNINNVFKEKGKSSADRDSQIAAFVEKEAVLLSPDVLLRPVLQDFLLPTVAYVGGPSEISYFAQLKRVYSLFDIPMPLIVPRWSGTVIDKKTLSFLKKILFDPCELLANDAKDILPQMVEKAAGKRFDAQFEKTHLQLQSRLNEIRKLGGTLDSTLVSMVDKSELKMKYQLNKMQARFQKALQAANRIAEERSKRAMNMIIPENRLQERTFSILNYLFRYGRNFTRFLSHVITTETDKHHIIEY